MYRRITGEGWCHAISFGILNPTRTFAASEVAWRLSCRTETVKLVVHGNTRNRPICYNRVSSKFLFETYTNLGIHVGNKIVLKHRLPKWRRIVIIIINSNYDNEHNVCQWAELDEYYCKTCVKN